MSHIITGSGYLNSPVRTLIIADDNRPGSYPVEMSPIAASLSGQFMRPYRDNVMPDTPVVYGQSRVIFNDIPADGTSVTLTNAISAAHQFTFRSEFPNASVTSNTINTFELVDGTDRYQGRTLSESSIRKLAMKFIDAVNGATGTLIVASPTNKYNEVLLTQQIPGSAGNTANSSTTAAVTISNFTGGNSGTVRYPLGISVGNGTNSQGAEITRRLINTSQSGTLDVPTSGKASRAGAYSDQHSYAAFVPYNESNASQAFGAQEGSREYGTKTRLYDDFFTRGSVSGSLDEPLWNKDKIVIDLSSVEETSLRFTNGTTQGPNYPMAYYNIEQKKWEPIGYGQGFGSLPATLQGALNQQYIGFSQGTRNLYGASNTSNVEIIDPQLKSTFTNSKSVFKEAGWFSPIDTFGFPLHPKYHATGSQQLDVSSIVDRPFLVEKIVYEFSASFSSNNGFSIGSDEYVGTGGAFFILNQRKANPDPGQESSYTSVYVSSGSGGQYNTPQEGTGSVVLQYDNGGIPRSVQLTPGGPVTYVDTVRDLVTFARFGTVWSFYSDDVDSLFEPGFPHPATFMDLAIERPLGVSEFTGSLTIAAPVRAPSQNSAVSNILLASAGSPVTVSPGSIKSFYASKVSSTRNSLDIPTGRSYSTEFLGPEISYRANAYNLDKRVFAPKYDSFPSPYIIAPGDKLIFGWQSPTTYSLTTEGTQINLLPGMGKLTLYGSYLRDEKPVHDIYKDQINSDAIHEAIPSGPWVLDRFETDPQMCYTGSIREMYVTGTMLSIGPNGRYTIPSESVLNSGSLGVRAIAATVSAGNVKQRWSFFRNVRLTDSEEQYYDSMQPNTFDWLMRPGVISVESSYFGSVAPPLNFVPIVVPGDQILDPTRAHIQTGSNREFIGSFPFESRYAEIPRVKSVNSRILLDRNVSVYNIGGAIQRKGGLTGGLLFFSSQNSLGGAQFSQSNLLRNGGIAKSVPIDTTGSPIPWGNNIDEGIMPSVQYDDPNDTNPVHGRIENTAYTSLTNMPLAFTKLVQRVTSVPNNISTNLHLSRFLGCFGAGFMGMVQAQNYSYGADAYTQATTFVYRGAKHGLINPTPLFTNAIFDGTHFGQFRDMLEQRQYTRFSLSDSTLTNSAVEVLFIDRNAPPGTLTITSGSGTNSSNVSPFATSEHPYDDALSEYGQIWDRQTTLPEVLAVLPP